MGKVLHEPLSKAVGVESWLDINCIIIEGHIRLGAGALLFGLLMWMILYFHLLFIAVPIVEFWIGIRPPKVLFLVNLRKSIALNLIGGGDNVGSLDPHDADHAVVLGMVKKHLFVLPLLELIV